MDVKGKCSTHLRKMNVLSLKMIYYLLLAPTVKHSKEDVLRVLQVMCSGFVKNKQLSGLNLSFLNIHGLVQSISQNVISWHQLPVQDRWILKRYLVLTKRQTLTIFSLSHMHTYLNK